MYAKPTLYHDYLELPDLQLRRDAEHRYSEVHTHE